MKLFLTAFLFCLSLVANAQSEATQSEITTKGGLVYKNNVLFTGTLYNDNANYLMLEANYKNGKLNGVKKEWYKNGKLKFEGNYNNGTVVGKIKKFDKYGNAILKNESISNEEILYYALKIYAPNEYTDYFSKNYLKKFDSNYDNYNRNEFELNRKKQAVKQTINSKIGTLNFNKVFKENKQTTLPKYSFETNSYNLKVGFFLNYIKNPNNLYLFYRSNMKSGDFRLTDEILKVNIANKNDFFEMKLSPKDAERLKNNFKYHNLYYSYEYKILPTKFTTKDGYRSSYSIRGILAYITVMKFYSDKNFTNLVHTIYPSLSYNDFVKKSNSNLTPKVNEVKKENNNRVKQTFKNNSGTASTTNNFRRRNTNQTNQNSSTLIIKSAEEGNVDSQYRLATMYATGNGLLKDSNKAFYWYKKSAKRGFAKSQEELAAIYYQKNDYNNAFIWYTKAANANHSRAQYILGYMYRKGIGVKKSRKKAKSWWKKSCQLGYKNSCEEIKKMNAFGNALLKSVNESMKNYKPKN